ncbi:MAG: hypothetical protein MHM6MM_007985 [Cercozoa sp. M6MM]
MGKAARQRASKRRADRRRRGRAARAEASALQAAVGQLTAGAAGAATDTSARTAALSLETRFMSQDASERQVACERVAAVALAGKLGKATKQVLPHVLQLLTDQHDTVRVSAAEAVRNMAVGGELHGDTQVSAMLCQLLAQALSTLTAQTSPCSARYVSALAAALAALVAESESVLQQVRGLQLPADTWSAKCADAHADVATLLCTALEDAADQGCSLAQSVPKRTAGAQVAPEVTSAAALATLSAVFAELGDSGAVNELLCRAVTAAVAPVQGHTYTGVNTSNAHLAQFLSMLLGAFAHLCQLVAPVAGDEPSADAAATAEFQNVLREVYMRLEALQTVLETSFNLLCVEGDDETEQEPEPGLAVATQVASMMLRTLDQDPLAALTELEQAIGEQQARLRATLARLRARSALLLQQVMRAGMLDESAVDDSVARGVLNALSSDPTCEEEQEQTEICLELLNDLAVGAELPCVLQALHGVQSQLRPRLQAFAGHEAAGMLLALLNGQLELN